MNNFLNSKQKIIYAEKRVNNFLNNAEQKIILCKIVEIVYTENSEQFLWENSEDDVQRANFINVETDFINAKKYIRFLWNSNMKKHSDLAFKFRKHDFTRCFMRKQ